MKLTPALIEKGIPSLAALAAFLAMVPWVNSYLRAPTLAERAFGLDHPAPTTSAVAASAPAGASFYNSAIAAPALPGAWPGFRGPNHDNVCTESVALARDWSAQPPKTLWSVRVGEGYAAPAIDRGRVILLDYDQGAQADSLRCFSLSDGAEIWRRSYPVTVKRNHGMSRTVPAISGAYVVSLGPKCHVLCADFATGAVKWQVDLVRDYGATVPEWYAGQCPLIDGDRVLLAPGGSALMLALDPATGRVLWKTPNPHNWLMTHSSILPVTVGGIRMYVYCGSGGVAGISAKDGSILWETDAWKIETATVPTPVDIGDGRLFLSGGYNAGSMMIRLQPRGAKFDVQTLFRLPAATFGSDQQTPILYKGFLYGVIPGGELVCLDLNGNPVWTSGPAHRFGLGPYMIADGLIYVMNDHGTLTLTEATPSGYRQLGETALFPDGQDAWGPFALAGGRLMARDLTRMVCLDVARR